MEAGRLVTVSDSAGIPAIQGPLGVSLCQSFGSEMELEIKIWRIMADRGAS